MRSSLLHINTKYPTIKGTLLSIHAIADETRLFIEVATLYIYI
jgi:hypothetical protein